MLGRYQVMFSSRGIIVYEIADWCPRRLTWQTWRKVHHFNSFPEFESSEFYRQHYGIVGM